MRNTSFSSVRAAAAALVVTALAPGCKLSEQTPPPLTGPSEFSLVLNTTTTADVIRRDGASEATITIQARSESGAPLAGQRIRLSASGPSNTQISASELITDEAGLATVSVTAPPSTSVGNLISLAFTPINSVGSAIRAPGVVSIGLTPSNATAPTAAFTIDPDPVEVDLDVEFNASESTDEGVACGTRCTYTWTFGDGVRLNGVVVVRSFASPGRKLVTLTVTDELGVAASASDAVEVTASEEAQSE